MATDLGKVGMRMRGDWNSSTVYEVLDAVSYAGGLYIAKQAVPANTLPTNTTYWQLAIDNNVVVESSKITPAAGITDYVFSGYRSGKVLSMYLQLDNGVNDNTVIATLDESICPSTAMALCGFSFYNNGKPANGQVWISRDDRNITYYGENIATRCIATVTYVIKII